LYGRVGHRWKYGTYALVARLGVGREANNLTPEKKYSIVQEPNRGKTVLIFWNDTGEGKA
jgi:hypothetical protein